MSALQIVVDGYAVGYENTPEVVACAREARSELAQLRAAAAEAQAAHVYLDESPVNDPNDPPLEIADRAARLVNEILQLRADLQAAQERGAEQARQLDVARDVIDYAYYILGNGDFRNGVTDSTGMIDEGDVCASRAFEKMRAWLSANPAPETEQP